MIKSFKEFFYGSNIFVMIEFAKSNSLCYFNPVGWDCRIHRLHFCFLQRGKAATIECPGYDSKPSDGEVPALKIGGIQRTSSLPLFPGSL